jgi:hypothetical protein
MGCGQTTVTTEVVKPSLPDKLSLKPDSNLVVFIDTSGGKEKIRKLSKKNTAKAFRK